MIMNSSDFERKNVYYKAYETIHKFFLKHERLGPNRIYHPLTKLAKFAFSELRWKVRGKKVLDIGCGEGWLCLHLKESCKKIIGIDISDTAIKLAKEKIRDERNTVEFIHMDARKLNFPSENFDFVISQQFVEHLHPKDMITHAKEVFRVLKMESIYLCDTPNRFVFIEEGLHLKTYTYSELSKIFRSVGFKVKIPLIPPCLLPIPIESKIILEKILAKLKFPNKAWKLMTLNFVYLINYKRRVM